jgi:hypothetical protein
MKIGMALPRSDQMIVPDAVEDSSESKEFDKWQFRDVAEIAKVSPAAICDTPTTSGFPFVSRRKGVPVTHKRCPQVSGRMRSDDPVPLRRSGSNSSAGDDGGGAVAFSGRTIVVALNIEAKGSGDQPMRRTNQNRCPSSTSSTR